MDIETRGIILSKQRITKVLIRLRSMILLLLFAYGKNRFSHDMAQIFNGWQKLCGFFDSRNLYTFRNLYPTRLFAAEGKWVALFNIIRNCIVLYIV